MSADREMKKFVEAVDIFRRCIGEEGIHADSTRYRYQCWTRDFSLAIQPAISLVEEFLPEAAQVSRRHLRTLATIQRPGGKIPILFLDGWRGQLAFLWDKVGKSIRDRKLSFMLRRYLGGHLADLTPGTRDSELHFARAAIDNSAASGPMFAGKRVLSEVQHARVAIALDYIEKNLLDDRGLLVGCDWRDTMEKELGGKALLSNNAILYSIYKDLGHQEKAAKLAKALAARSCGFLGDYEGAGRPDPLGLSLGVLYDLIPPERYADVLGLLREVDSPRGVTIQCRHNPQDDVEAEVIERTDGVVVWPFVVGFAILALVKIARDVIVRQSISTSGRDLAHAQWKKLLWLDGHREWYDPLDGWGHGAREQLWSAALFLRARDAMVRL